MRCSLGNPCATNQPEEQVRPVSVEGVVPALPIGEGGTVIKNDLENQGYTCEVVSVGFWECAS